MPFSSPKYKMAIRKFFEKSVPPSTQILDVGPGMGQYGHLLKDLGYTIDAVEIFEPYIERYNLKEKYNNIYIDNIMNFDFSKYSILILGDILEHLSIEDAHKLLNKITKNKQKCIVCVPYELEQGEAYGNIYETHHQPDLTPNIMKERYPQLKFMIGDKDHGYYKN